MSPTVSASRLAKTTRPRISDVFWRERLFRVLEDSRASACTWIEGPPGSGKTSLLASFVSAAALECLWYQVDPDDSDPTAFFACMLAAARRALGGDAAAKLPALTPDALFGLAGYARLFFAQLFDLAPRLTVVVDDYHEAPLDCALHDISRVAIEQALAEAHIAVASRSQPPPQLARLRMIGVVQAIARAQLRLTADEVVGIAALHGTTMDPSHAEHWRGRCGGWVAGLRLLLRPDAPANLRVAATEPRSLLFDYLGQEVFCKLKPSDQSLLLRLALLPRMLVAVIGELEDSAVAERCLDALARQSLFTTVSNDGAAGYTFHPLFREFLLHRARCELPAQEVTRIGHRTADALQSRGLAEDAAHVLIGVSAWPRLAQLILREAASCLALGRNKTLEQWLCALPAAMLEQDPWLLYWLGACRAQLDPASARGSMERAFALFDARQDTAGLLLAWAGVVDCIFYMYFDLTQFDPWIARLDEMDDAGLSFPSREVESRVSFSMFVALAFRQPQHPKFGIWRRRLAACADATPDSMFRQLARLHLLNSQVWSGDLHCAGVALHEMKRESSNRQPTPFVELVGCLSESTLALYAGEVDACFDAIDRGLATAQASGIHIWDKVLLGQGAAIAASHGQLERAQAFAARRAASARAGDLEEQSFYHAIEAWSCWLRERQAEALAHARQSIDVGRRMGLPHFSAINALTMAIVCFDCGDRSAGIEQLASGRAIGVLTHNPMLEWMADLLEAYMRLQQGEPATDLITRCMAAGRQHGYRHFFFWPRRAVARVCVEALAMGIQPEYVRELIDKGRLPRPESALGEYWPWPVKVYTLGQFLVLVHGTPIRFEGKAPRAPLNLLKAIIAHGGRDVPEAKVIDDLWPEADGDAGEQALATTLSRLRKLVGAAAIRRQAGHLSLDGRQCWVDCQALQRWVLDPPIVPSRATYELIKRLYLDEFLHGEGDAPWMLPLRERLHVAVVKVLSGSGDLALAKQQVALAAEFYELGLHIDDLVESFHAGLMRCYLRNGQPSLAMLVYQRCKRTLLNRLGVTPSESTARLHLAASDAGSKGP
jgi:ATP/maltotriose-dependent transcriptional regulator MalT/DNA-binding SARP family transcriptional activator